MMRFLLIAALLGGLPAGSGAGPLISRESHPAINWQSLDDFATAHGGLEGQRLTVLGPWLGADRDMFNAVLAHFAEATGAVAHYSGSDSFEQQVVIGAEAGAPPDIAMFPQPGLAADLAREGKLVPLDAETGAWLRENFAAGESWAALVTYSGPDGAERVYALPYKADLKSLVWYVPENFEDAGYAVPASLEGLRALTEQIAQDDQTPWCIGLGSGGATGWPGTDWVEDLLLRLSPPEIYDRWVSNDLPFDAPEIIAAIEAFGWFARDDRFVRGGAASVAAGDFRDSPIGLFSSPPGCYLHRQGSFITSYFPEGTQIGEDADFFYFPASDAADLGQPVLGAGTMAARMTDNPAGAALIAFLQTPAAHEIWMAQEGFVTPHLGANTAIYADDAQRRMGEIMRGASVFRFDGSDLMPGAIGAGAFWTAMVDYTSGKSAEEVAGAVQATWDALR